MRNPNPYRSRLLTSTCAFALAVAGGSASAQEIDINQGNYVVGINQTFNGFGGGTASITAITGQDDVSRDVQIGFIVNDAVSDSSLVVGGPTGNTTSANLTVNLAETTLNSEANNDDFKAQTGSAVAGTELDQRERADADTSLADLAIATAQNVNNTAATATNASAIGSLSESVTASTVTVADNTQESVGLLNRNTTTINSDANATDASIAIATSQNVTTGVLQPNEDGTSLTVTTSSVAEIQVFDGVANVSTLDLSGNTQRAVAAGNVGQNVIDSEANDLKVASRIASTLISDDARATAGNAIASSQFVDLTADGSGPITATVDGGSAGFVVAVFGDDNGVGVDNSTVTNEDNAAVALALGNEVFNSASLSANSIATVDEDDGVTPAPGAAAAVASLQGFDGEMTAQAITGITGDGVRTLIVSGVNESTVRTSSNTIQATATANTGSNRVMADANDITTGGDGSTVTGAAEAVVVSGPVRTSNAGFELSSSQIADGSITATLKTDDLGTVTSARILTQVGNDISESTVMSDGNLLQASATGNEITEQTNLIDVSGTNVATTTALANLQGLAGDVSALIGQEGGLQEVTDTFTISLSFAMNAQNMNAATYDATGIPQDAVDGIIDFLQGQGFLVSQSGSVVTVIDSSSSLVSQTFNETLTYDTVIPAAGGVIVDAGGAITDSTVTVDANTTRGTVTGNTATNRIDVSATNLDSVTTAMTSVATDMDPLGFASAENALANAQVIDGSDLVTDVAGTFAIDGDLTSYDTSN